MIKFEWVDSDGNVLRTDYHWSWWDRLHIWAYGKLMKYTLTPEEAREYFEQARKLK